MSRRTRQQMTERAAEGHEEVFIRRRRDVMLETTPWGGGEKGEAGNFAASVPLILSLPDMCASIDTCRGHADGAVSAPCVISPPTCSACWWWMPDKGVNAGRKEILTGSHVTVQKKKKWKKTFFFPSEELHLAFTTCSNTVPLCVSVPPTPAGSVSLGVFLVSVAFVVCTIWLVALCGVCTWCQRKLVGYRPAAHFTLFGLKTPFWQWTKTLVAFLGGLEFQKCFHFYAGLQASCLNNKIC